MLVCWYVRKYRNVKSWQLPGFEPWTHGLRCQCCRQLSYVTARQQSALTMLSAYIIGTTLSLDKYYCL